MSCIKISSPIPPAFLAVIDVPFTILRRPRCLFWGVSVGRYGWKGPPGVRAPRAAAGRRLSSEMEFISQIRFLPLFSVSQ